MISKNVANWCNGNKANINIKHTKGMIVGTRSMVKKHRLLPKLNIDGVPLEYVFQYKYLGINVDESLTFHSHLKNTIKILAHKIHLLQKYQKLY